MLAVATPSAPGGAATSAVLEKLGFRRDHITTDDRGEVVWQVRDL